MKKKAASPKDRLRPGGPVWLRPDVLRQVDDLYYGLRCRSRSSAVGAAVVAYQAQAQRT